MNKKTNLITDDDYYLKVNQLTETCFERAIFLSWYCSRGDCSFCYMSTLKDRIKDPAKARRSLASIFAEAIITKACGWEVEFISGGYESFSFKEILFIVKTIKEIAGKKQWLNLGVLKEEELKQLKPYIEGVIGAVECINPAVRKKACPSKPMDEILSFFGSCDKLQIKKGITIIIGLGESIKDFKLLKDFIEENKISRITFYALNPHKGTPFKSSPSVEYYSDWIQKTRESFPGLKIIAGAWHDKTSYFSMLLKAGADDITKFPALRLFSSKKARSIEEEVKLAGRKFIGSFTKVPDIGWDAEVQKLTIEDSLKRQVRKKVSEYLTVMRKGESS